jgi:endogenous inhibitor of DNA gyrase (YacG/DUF329 family)
MSSQRTVACPQCSAPVVWNAAAKYRPFCSERCKLIDLGAWASESYRIPVADGSVANAPEDDTGSASGRLPPDGAR